MNITYSLSVEPKITNKWQIVIKWMSGDADAFANEVYWADSKEEFVKIHSLFEKIFQFKEKHHNLFCDVRRDSLKEIFEHDERYPAIAMKPEVEADLLEFFGHHTHFSDLFDEAGINASYDVTYEGSIASPQNITSMNYWDANGVKHDITVHP